VTRRRLRRLATATGVVGAQLVALAVIVAVVYALIVLGIGDVPTARQWTLIAFSAVAAAVVAVVYARVGPRVKARTAAMLSRAVGSPNELARAFAQRVAGGLPVDDLVAALIESLRSGLALAAAEVWTASAGTLELAGADPPRPRATVSLQPSEAAVVARAGVVGRSWVELWLPGLVDGDASSELRAVPMIHASEVIGLIVVRREHGRPFSADGEEALALIARQAALAFRNVRLGSALEASLAELQEHAEALRASRARVVAAGDAERRRIERNLHDGAQQHLIGLAVNLKVARELAQSEPERAAEILAQLSAEVHAAIEELRDLAHGIYPPLLAERGLADAVRGALARSGAQGAVRADGLGRFSPTVESTAYFCCVEGIQNAVKHGDGARVAVRLWTQTGTLMFEVDDDGPGFDPATATEGAGITNMRDRVGALGGTLRVDASPGGGTHITAALPLVSAAGPRGREAPPSPGG
jgi:signal transduction histidine kinase